VGVEGLKGLRVEEAGEDKSRTANVEPLNLERGRGQNVETPTADERGDAEGAEVSGARGLDIQRPISEGTGSGTERRQKRKTDLKPRSGEPPQANTDGHGYEKGNSQTPGGVEGVKCLRVEEAGKDEPRTLNVEPSEVEEKKKVRVDAIVSPLWHGKWRRLDG
jgi:hypothetical protein